MANFYGNSAGSTHTGTDSDDSFWVYGGDDTVYGKNGKDHIYGGAGNDKLLGRQ